MEHASFTTHQFASTIKAKNSMLPQFANRIIAAPSWVMAGTIKENCEFLVGKVHEVGLLFFETKSSLTYTSNDLPYELSLLPLSFHVHLPSDLRGKNGKDDALLCCELMKKVSFLAAERAVLHVPAKNPVHYLEAFVQQWEDAGYHSNSLLLENTKEQSLLSLQDAIEAMNLSLCLDTGHALAYGQKELFFCQKLIAKTRMIHFNIPGEGAKASSHLPLTAIKPSMSSLFINLIANVSDQTVFMLELFQWEKIEVSLPLLHQWIVATKNISVIK